MDEVPNGETRDLALGQSTPCGKLPESVLFGISNSNVVNILSVAPPRDGEASAQ